MEQVVEQTVVETYMTLGALGLSFVVLIGIIVFTMMKIVPALNQVTISNAEFTVLIKNYTLALDTVVKSIEEVGKSNENVAHMLELLSTTIKSNSEKLEKHDSDSNQRINEALTHLTRHDDRGQRIEMELGKVKGKVEQVQILVNQKGV